MISEDDKIIKEFREKFLVKRKDSESVNFKNRNEDTLAFEIEEFILQTRKEDREEIKRVLEGLKRKKIEVFERDEWTEGREIKEDEQAKMRNFMKQTQNQAVQEQNKKINEAIKNL